MDFTLLVLWFDMYQRKMFLIKLILHFVYSIICNIVFYYWINIIDYRNIIYLFIFIIYLFNQLQLFKFKLIDI